MGFKITLEGERGDVEDTVLDPTHLLNGVLPPVSDQTYRCLGYVDEYGVDGMRWVASAIISRGWGYGCSPEVGEWWDLEEPTRVISWTAVALQSEQPKAVAHPPLSQSC
jgi:hypothetical protein